MDKQFTLVGRAFRMRDPNSFGADARLQQTRRLYFQQTEGEKFFRAIRESVEKHTGEYKSLERMLDEGKLDLLAEEIRIMREPRYLQRARYEEWYEGSVNGTPLDDVLTACALLEPVDGGQPLDPQDVLNANTYITRQELAEVISFFIGARETSLDEFRKQQTPSENTPAETNQPSTESST